MPSLLTAFLLAATVIPGGLLAAYSFESVVSCSRPIATSYQD